MDIGVVGGGINGLCCAWQLAQQGHTVSLYERDAIMNATSRASSKLLHGGLRYLENGEFRLVREALRERDAWIQRVPELAKPLRLVIPVYRNARRQAWMYSAGLFLYDNLAGKSRLPKARRIHVEEIISRDPTLVKQNLLGGYEFSDGLMDDYTLGLWVAEEARKSGVAITEHCEVTSIDCEEGVLKTADGKTFRYDRVLNIAGPWAHQLLQRSGIEAPYMLDPIRGSHLVLDTPCNQAYLLEIPGERRIFFVLPWKGQTLLGTTEVRQSLDDQIVCSKEDKAYLLAAYRHYFPDRNPEVVETFSGLRPLLYSAKDPSLATREYAFHRTGNLLTVFGGKWTTAMALAEKVTKAIQ
ncbi:MAG: glycerol-3-phosphate dehydrogenase/oxidase [Desulfobulbaceae bacterium]|nr:glycerol-3-phosphate dehydrogenase/oxidase [Desulfobulbaceae bacterium]